MQKCRELGKIFGQRSLDQAAGSEFVHEKPATGKPKYKKMIVNFSLYKLLKQSSRWREYIAKKTSNAERTKTLREVKDVNKGAEKHDPDKLSR